MNDDERKAMASAAKFHRAERLSNTAAFEAGWAAAKLFYQEKPGKLDPLGSMIMRARG